MSRFEFLVFTSLRGLHGDTVYIVGVPGGCITFEIPAGESSGIGTHVVDDVRLSPALM